MLTPNHEDLLPTLRTLFPTGSSNEHRTGAGQLIFYTYEVEPETHLATTDPVDPVKSLKIRRLVVWIFAVFVYLLLSLLGLLTLLRQPPVGTSSAARDEQTSSILTPLSNNQLHRTIRAMGASLILAFVAQHLFNSANPLSATGTSSGTGWLISGAILYVAAMVLFALAAPGWQTSQSAPQHSNQPDPPSAEGFAPDARIMHPGAPERPTPKPASSPAVFTSSGIRWQVLLFVLAIIPYALALFLFQIKGENSLVRWLWLIGLLLFLGGQVVRPALLRVGGANAEWSPRFQWWNSGFLLIILIGWLLAALQSIWQIFPTISMAIWPQWAFRPEIGLQGDNLISSGKVGPISLWSDSCHPPFF